MISFLLRKIFCGCLYQAMKFHGKFSLGGIGFNLKSAGKIFILPCWRDILLSGWVKVAGFLARKFTKSNNGCFSRFLNCANDAQRITQYAKNNRICCHCYALTQIREVDLDSLQYNFRNSHSVVFLKMKLCVKITTQCKITYKRKTIVL